MQDKQGKFLYGFQTWYPHMKPADVHLWEKFIQAYPGMFDRCDYDYPVGKGPEWMDTENNDFHANQEILYKKKIDVLAFQDKDEVTWIIEIKPFAGSSALGQLKMYKILYLQQHPAVKNLRLAIVTNQAQNMYKKIFDHEQIRLFEVGICERCAHYRA